MNVLWLDLLLFLIKEYVMHAYSVNELCAQLIQSF